MTIKTILVAAFLSDGRGSYSQLPFWKHDCDKCAFLGHTWTGGDRDVWFCPDSTTLVVRNSSDPADYVGFPVAAAVAVAKAEGPGTMWSEAVSRYDDALGTNYMIHAHQVDLQEDEPQESEWDGEFTTVVGLYDDLQVKKVDKNIWVKDQHGNQLFVARYHEDGGAWQIEMEDTFGEVVPQKVLGSEKAIMLYALLVRQAMTDAGY